jgi:ElaB/YqjD/DUF883 family membrane-anchored ribosome-binding protein
MNAFGKTVSELGERVSDAKETIENMARSTGQQLDDARRETADALYTASSAVRSTGRRGADAIGKAAGGAADKLDATASYVEDHDVRSSLTSLRRFGRRHPAATMAAGVAIGMLAGSLVTRIALGGKDWGRD